MKKVLGCLSMAVLAIVLATPAPAQRARIQLMATVPFEFVVGGITVPAGDYAASTDDAGVVAIENLSTGNKTFTVSNAGDGPGDHSGAFLLFHRYGSQYFLAEIWDGYMSRGSSIPMSSTERESAKTASLHKPEVVMVLARR